MRCVILVEILALIVSHAAGVLLADRTPEQQAAIDEIQERHDHYRVTP
jgi:hypothetical protein